MKYIVKNEEGYLVQGKIGSWSFDGKGKPYEFNEKDAFLLRDEFGYTLEISENK